MNISRSEQRVLHALAQGGAIRHQRADPCNRDRITAAHCFTRDGLVLADFPLALFARLKRRGFIASHGGQPYRITPRGLAAVRAQLDNR